MRKPNWRLIDLKMLILTRCIIAAFIFILFVSVLVNVQILNRTEFIVIHQSHRVMKLVNYDDNIFHRVIFNKKQANQELKCLVSNIYFEAAQESTAGKLAVALVTINRVKDQDFPNTICGVVFEGQHRKDLLCQFSWTCSPTVGKHVPKQTTGWEQSEKIAKIVMFQKESIVDITGGAIYYHADYVNPKWSKIHTKVVTIDRHIFYRAADTKNVDLKIIKREIVNTELSRLKGRVTKK